MSALRNRLSSSLDDHLRIGFVECRRVGSDLQPLVSPELYCSRDLHFSAPAPFATRGNMTSSIARAKPSSALLVVANLAAALTSALALPIAMLTPVLANMSMSV